MGRISENKFCISSIGTALARASFIEIELYLYFAPAERNTFFDQFSINMPVRWTLIHFPKFKPFTV